MKKLQLVEAAFSALALVGLTSCTTPGLTPAERAEGQRIEAMAADNTISAKMVALAAEKFSDVVPLPPRTQADVQYPEPKLQAEPVYPYELRKKGLQGLVWLGVVVDENGKVGRIEVLSSERPGFNEAAEAAVRRWLFRPAAVNGKPVQVVLCFPLAFTLK